MNLKHLELHGYKSFANRTEFAFHDGVTAIVGPNGSGKSNVADAIQWVLGEQSFSNLRAKKTEDMIFAGSSMRVRMGMAEVSLTLDNSTQWLPIDFSEVTITRRAYRSGENEYLLNGTRMRLRDLSELLSKGGLGRGSYTVIGQGLIDSAISLRPEERRSLLEDAAGISIYQSKKADALAKLNSTQENLTRVSDILHELEPRVKRLREQANRASQFAEVQRRLAEHLQTWYGYQWQQAQEKLAEAELTRARAHEALLAARESLQSSDAERAQLRERIATQRRALSAWQQQLSEQERAAQELTQRQAVAQERLALLGQQQADALRESEALSAEENTLRLTREQSSADLAQLQTSAQEAQTQLSELQQQLAQYDEAQRAIRAVHADAQRAAMEAATRLAEQTQRVASARQRLQSIESEQAQHEQSLAQTAQTLQQLDERIAQTQSALAAVSAQLDEHNAQYAQAHEQASALQTQTAALSAQAAEAQAQLRAAQIESSSARARDMQVWHELARTQDVALVGPLRALYRVAPEHDRVVRGALGYAADALVVHRWQDARQLAAQAQTRQTILVLEAFSTSALPLTPAHNPNGERSADESLAPETQNAVATTQTFDTVSTRQSALSLIECAPEHRPLFETLLVGVHLDGEPPRVEAEGTLVTAHALITPDLSAPNLAQLDASMNECEARAQHLSARLAETRARASAALQARDALNHQRYERENARTRLQAELDGLTLERERTTQQSQRAADALQRLQAERAALSEQLAEAEQSLQTLEQQNAAAAVSFAPTLEDEHTRARQFAQQETRAALLQQELQSRQQLLAQYDERLRALAAQREARTRRAEALLAETTRLRAELAQLAAQMQASTLQSDPLRAQIAPAAAQLSADESALRELEAHERAAREALYAAESAHSQALVDLQRRQDRQVTLREQIESDYEFVSLTTDLPMQLALEIDETRLLKLPHVRELPEGMEQEIRSLKNKMRWIGNVNLEAPSEYALEKARLEFLSVQSTDLQRASESLQQLVAELDQLMQQKFRETFNAVARAFKEYFTKLFGGGSAELVLTEPENLIATGIDILAHPPGKRRQPLGLLSGGERALTAGALIFALLKASPTPFCVLDEVDAALDEANVGRFRSVLRELAERTQFIIVTHNRGTVEAAGTVYGISMGADGASQMISLRLDGVDVNAQPAV